MEDKTLTKKDIVFYARILPNVGVYEVCELKVRCVEDDWFSAIEKRTKRAYIFNNSTLEKTVFINRQKALDLVLEAEAENKGRTFSEKDTDIYS